MSGLITLDEYRDGGWHRRVTRCSECKKELRTADEWRDCRRQHMLEYLWRTDPKGMDLAAKIHEGHPVCHSEKEKS